MNTAVVLVIHVLICAGVTEYAHDKRILLHSDSDIAQAIQDLKADNAELQSQLSVIESTSKVDKEQLQTTLEQIQNRLDNVDSTREAVYSQLQSNIPEFQRRIAQLQNENIQLQSKLANVESMRKADHTEFLTKNTQLQNQYNQLKNNVDHIKSRKGSGATYVRWGRTTCPGNGTTLAYSGYMGGGKHTDPGGAVNHVCLTDDPIWGYFNPARNSGGKIYGVEYELFGASPFFGTDLANHDAPCAVCHSPRSAVMMVPGRNQCYPGWNVEYSGYLVSGGYGHPGATEYICLDGRPEVVVGGADNDNENLLYIVEGVCGGALECPPYVNGQELTCVVCTK